MADKGYISSITNSTRSENPNFQVWQKSSSSYSDQIEERSTAHQLKYSVLKILIFMFGKKKTHQCDFMTSAITMWNPDMLHHSSYSKDISHKITYK